MAWRMVIVFLLYILAVLVYLLDFFSKQLGITLHRSTCVGWGDLRWYSINHIHGLVHDCSNSIANTLELLQSYTKPSIWYARGFVAFCFVVVILSILGVSAWNIHFLPIHIPWWCHEIDCISALLALCEGNPKVIGGFQSQRASDAELWCFLWYKATQTGEQAVKRHEN